MSTRKTGPHGLVREFISKETIQCAQHLHDGSEAGVVIGAVIGYLYTRRRYGIAICGEAQADPTWARGVLGAIEDELRDMIHERSLGDTTM